ncbi:MAG: acyltransferase family protein [Actinomycetota bacterium]|nr:acyltransferase family protein [Actinomycetota bacterium]
MAEQERPAFTYIPGIDGIRGIWVVIGPLLYHAATDTVSGGILGIDLFFTLSSFLIISIALNEFEKTGRIDLKAYAGRRARRLLPALFLALGVLTLYLILFVPVDQYPRWTGAIVSALAYCANWFEIFSGVSYFEDFQHSPLRHVWSFSIEEQFYIFAPLYLITVLHFFKKHAYSVLLWTMVAGTIASTWWMGHLYPGGGDPSRVYYGTDTRAHSLFAGIILAVIVRQRGPVRTRRAQLWWVAGAYASTFFFAWAIFEISEQSAWMFEHGGFLLVAALSCVMVYGVAQPAERAWHAWLPTSLSAPDAPIRSRIWVGAMYAGLFTGGWAIVSAARGNAPFDHWPYLLGVGIGWFWYGCAGAAKGPLHWFLESPIIRWVGKISYGLYLYHWPIYLLVTPTRAARLVPGVDVIEGNNLIWLHLAITFAVSTASFYLVEQPVVRRRVPLLDRPMKPIPALAASAVAVVAILGGLLWVNTRPADEAAASSLGQCAEQGLLPPSTDDRLRVLVVGDSVALQIGEALCTWAIGNPGEIVVLNEAHLGCIVGRYGQKRIPEGIEGPVGELCSAWNDPVEPHVMLDPEVVSWPTAVEVFEPEVVLSHVTPWDVTDRLVPSLGDEWVNIGMTVYDDYISSEYRLASEVLGATGAQVVWLEGAHLKREIRPQNHPDRIDRLNELVVAATVDLDFVTTVPYRDFIGDIGSERERHTRFDGVHLSEAGVAEVGAWLMDGILNP